MPTDPNSLVKVIQHNRTRKTSAATIVEGNAAGLPIVSKLTSDKSKVTPKADDSNIQINRNALETLHYKMANTRNNNKNIITLFPDIELAIQILVSSILSPKKMTDIQLNYRFNKNFIVDSNVSAGVLSLLKEYVDDNYELEDKLPEIVREALFVSGSCPYAIIAESAVDEIVNADLISRYSTEEFKTNVDVVLDKFTRPINIIKNEPNTTTKLNETPSLEEFTSYLTSNDFINITDNMNIVQYGDLKDKIVSSIVKKELRKTGSISLESKEKIEYLDIFRNRSNQRPKPIQFVKTKEETYRKTIGKPLLIKLPPNSVIPTFIPGNESEHMGYFVLLDENYKPISTGISDSDINRLDTSLNSTSTKVSPIQKAYNNLVNTTSNNVDVNTLFDTYKEVLEKQLFDTVKTSISGKSVSIAERNDIYFTMFSRALQDQKTTILYLRKESVVYYAFQYNEMGTGKSLLDNMAVQASMRAILLFSRIMSEAKQAIDVTRVNIEFDENDPDPEKTLETVQSAVLKLRQNFLPLGINNPVDLVNWVQRAGLQFSFSNSPMFPNTQISFENGGVSHTVPSGDLEEELRKQSIIALGLPPDMVDNGFSPEFARSVINNNILLSKRVGVYQKKLNAHNTKFVNLVIYNDEELRAELKELLLEKKNELVSSLDEEQKALFSKDEDGFIDSFIDEIADNIYLELPKPEETDISNLSVEYDLYKENLEKTIDSIISTELFTEDMAGDISNNIETIKTVYKHHLLRKWMADNNYYPELLEITLSDAEEVESLLSSISTHLTSTMRNSDKLFRMMKDVKIAVNADLKETFDGESPEGSVETSSTDPDSESETDDEEDSSLGGDPDDIFKL